MPSKSISAYDPRTIAREVAGIIESVFPQLVPGMALHLNRTHSTSNSNCEAVPKELMAEVSLQQAMLFELGIAVGESLLLGVTVDWASCLSKAVSRQRRYYDAEIPEELLPADKLVAMLVGKNLSAMLRALSEADEGAVNVQPRIPGYRWIASGTGDFATEKSIIEVKCSNKRFSTADYRQLLFYWLLAYCESLEKDLSCWTTGVLMNPRINFIVEFRFAEFVPLVAFGKSSVQVAESFAALFSELDSSAR